MNKILHFAIFLALMWMWMLTPVAAQEEYSADNEGWMVDIEKAHEESVRTGKPIMANFTGSDWCGWCKRLTASVFSKQEFKDWAEDKDRKSTRLNSSHVAISYAVFCLKKNT